MNEAETRAELMDPTLKAAGWGVVEASRVRREVIAPGRLEGSGRRAKAEIADYVLVYRNKKLAVIEAKRLDLLDTEGVGQAKHYAGKPQTRFAFSTNGTGIYQIDMHTGAEAHVVAWPSPEELWASAFPLPNAWRDRFAAVPMVEKGTEWTVRDYQANAVERTLERIEEGDRRILLTLATGTGKTSIAFQIVWELFEAKWSLSGEPTRRPRILFLADRNNSPIRPLTISARSPLSRKTRSSASSQTKFPSGAGFRRTVACSSRSSRRSCRHATRTANPRRISANIRKDFFDCCRHRRVPSRRRHDESTWRGILEYFSPAAADRPYGDAEARDQRRHLRLFRRARLHLFVEAGHQRRLSHPFKVRQIATTLDDYIYTPDDEVLEGEIQQGRRYTETDFNR